MVNQQLQCKKIIIELMSVTEIGQFGPCIELPIKNDYGF